MGARTIAEDEPHADVRVAIARPPRSTVRGRRTRRAAFDLDIRPSPAVRLARAPFGAPRRMHVTLIRPPLVIPRSAPRMLAGTPPIGVALLAAVVEQAGHAVTAIDAYGEAPAAFSDIDHGNLSIAGLTADEIARRIPADTDVIGVSCMFSQEWLYAKRVIAAAQAAAPGATVIVGGEHATADPAHVLRRAPEVAACVLGEGEETLLDVVDALTTGRSLRGVAGLAVRGDEGGCIRTAARPRIVAIDDLPWPAWEHVPLEIYLENHCGHGEQRRRTVPMLATRGCPYRCTFCSSPTMWGTKWLARDPADVIAEIKHYHRLYGIEHVEFYDLTAVIDRRWTLRFAELLAAEDLPISWQLPSGTRSEALDAEVLQAMYRSKCVAVLYAPESGSPRTLARIKKKTSPARMLASMRDAVRTGMHVRGHFIMGMPGQTLSEIAETFGFIARMAWIGVHDVNSYFFSPYPGSEMYRALVAQGAIDPDAADYDELLATAMCYTDFANVRSFSEYFSAAALRFFVLSSMAFFYAASFVLRPQRAFRTVWNAARGKPVTWVERVVHHGLRRFVLRQKAAPLVVSRRTMPPEHAAAARAQRTARGVVAVA
jgi:anaerobic magnesium-protoporphyrin IX monomethyl ester cyclase